ncbi:hypothetical protein BWQ96_06599 [Gracilariopsis chorda]|uniref:Uncharacterized protein n=1 Tax=Gracilariopsis chorda TaxID=448386 RepID=A0A2V3IR53_9FLOR|nr:hypothetical protein BWQ96_06599 [Gracilariopsis chorda]|eukprot:PXF43640.1 hypothetical protein BWQ96_06599 [Gracilariopsis chorda]
MKLIPDTLNTVTNRLRENSNIACEMFNDGCVEVYYGRLLTLIEFKLDLDLTERWSHWQKKYEVGLLSWASGMEVNGQGQVFKRYRSANAFKSRTIENLSIVYRLISVVDHVVLSQIGANRVRHQCYFIDDKILSDNLTNGERTSEQSLNKVL